MKHNNIAKVIAALVLIVICSCSGNKEGYNFSYDLIPVMTDGKWGYIDINGKTIINAQYKDAYLFADGLALVQTSDGKMGYIGADGKYVIKPIYKGGTNFSEGLAFVTVENGYPMCINKSGDVQFTLDKTASVSSFFDGLAVVEVGDKYGLIDKSGKIILNPQYSFLNPLNEGLGQCCKREKGVGVMDTKWGYIDKSGKIIINFQFKYASAFSEGLATVGDGEKFGYIDKKGVYVINPQFESAKDFSEGLAAIQQGGKWGYIDTKGKIVINPQFEMASSFHDGIASVKAGEDSWGYINKEGKYVINPQFAGASRFFGKFAVVVSGDKEGLINKEGKYLVNPQFESTFVFRIKNDFYYGDGHVQVSSDFFDGKEFCDAFFTQSAGEEFKEFTKGTTLKDVVDQTDRPQYLKLTSDYSIQFDHQTFEKGDVEIGGINYSFGDRIYDVVPEYSSGFEIGSKNEFNGNTQLRKVAYNFQFSESGRSHGKGKVLAKAISNKIKQLYSAREDDPKGGDYDVMLRRLDSMLFNTVEKRGYYIFLYTPSLRFAICYNEESVRFSVGFGR